MGVQSPGKPRYGHDTVIMPAGSWGRHTQPQYMATPLHVMGAFRCSLVVVNVQLIDPEDDKPVRLACVCTGQAR